MTQTPWSTDARATTGAATKQGRILILCPYPPGTAPSQRFRFEQYIPALEQEGFEVVQEGFWDQATWSILYRAGHKREKIQGLVGGFLRRLKLLRTAGRFDYVFIHLEATPLGPPLVELALLALRKKIIFDIDDAIFIPKTSRENRVASWIRWRSKVSFLAKRSYKVTAVNPFLVEWAEQFRDSALLIPTTIDPTYHRPALEKAPNVRPILGWTGTKTTAPFLDLIRAPLRELQRDLDFELRVICNVDPGFSDLERYRFVKWTQETEIEDLQAFDVGLMPVEDAPFSKGKVGFKAIQYSAVGIPPIVSDVGSGREVVDHGRTGLVVPNEPDAWREAMRKLILDRELRRTMGEAARQHILERYSIPAQTPNYVGLFS